MMNRLSVLTGQLQIEVLEQSPCLATPDVGDPGPDLSFTQVIADARAIDSGAVLSSETEMGSAMASVSDSGMGFSYTCSGSASFSTLSGNCTHSEGTDTMLVSAIAQSEMLREMAMLRGVGSGRAIITVRLSGEIEDSEDGSAFFSLEFDPDDEVGGESVSFGLGGGSGPRSIEETLTVDAPFEFNLSTPTRIYRQATLSVGADARATATVISASLSIGGCIP